MEQWPSRVNPVRSILSLLLSAIALSTLFYTVTRLQLEGSLRFRRAGDNKSIVSIQACVPVLEISKSNDPSVVSAGEVLTYTILYSNTGSVTATRVTIADILPLNTRFITATGSFRPLIPSPGDILTWDAGTLEGNGTSGIITLVVTVTAPLTHGTIITNQAGIVCSEGVWASSNIVSAFVQSAPVLSIMKTSDPSPTVTLGSKLTYTIAYSNSGNMVASGVWITDVLDEHAVVQSTSLITDSHHDQVLTWEVGSLSPVQGNQVLTFEIIVNDMPGDHLITNTVLLGGDQVPTVSYTLTTEVEEAPGPRRQETYLPIIFQDYNDCYLDEPNDILEDAKPVISGRWYCALPDDVEDYYTFSLTITATVNVEIHNYTPAESGQLLLYDADFNQEGHCGNDEQSKHIGPKTLGPGQYYVRIYTSDKYDDQHLYNLKVTY